MKFILNGDKLTVENEECANSGSVQYYEVDVEHNEEWNALSIEAVIVPKEGGAIIFDDAQSIAVIDNKMYIDRELNGSYAIGFKGFTIENEVKVYQISTNLQGVYFNVGAGQIITTNSIPKPSEWEIYVAQIETIANRASQSADNAQTSADNASSSEQEATRQAGIATTQAGNAATSANTATEQAGIATAKAEIATTKAGEASTSATKAKTSEDNAKASEQSASSSASSASTSATSAGNSASSAATSASLASSSEGVASQKAGEASASASSASASATAAEQSKNTAQGLVNGFGTTVETATNNFNTNATNKTNTFNTNATNKTNAFNENATQKTNDFNDNATQKTNDFNTNASDKTTEFNEVVDTAKDDIEEIAPMLQDKMSKIETFLQPATKTGTSIHTTDSADWYGKLNFEGFSRQETTTGANILKFTERTAGSGGMAYSCDNKGQVILTGTATSSTGYAYNQSADAITLNAGTYKFKVIGKYDTLKFIRSDKNSIITLNENGEGTVIIENDNTAFRILAYTTIDDTYNCNFYLTLTAEATATTERYTGGIPQPNINYPSEIRNLTGDVQIKQINKNYLDVELQKGYWNIGDKTLSASSSTIFKSFSKALKAGTYVLSCNTNLNIVRALTDYDNSSTVIFSGAVTNVNTFIMTITENTTLYMSVRRNDNTDWLDTDLLQLEWGQVSTDHEANHQKTITFPLGNEKMYQGSTLTDNGKQHIRKQIIFDGTEDGWSIGNTGTENFYYRYRYLSDRIAKQSSQTNDLCNRFTIASISSSNTVEGFYILADGEIRIRFGTQKTIAEFKTWLAEHPLTIEYELAEPEIVPYTQAQQEAYDELQNLETYQYVNNIELIANEETNMTFEYKEDIQMQIKEETSKLTQAIVALGGVVE